MDFALLSVALILLSIALYVIADGVDLGVGLLILLAPREEGRDLMMLSLEPSWDGNETWLVFGGVLLWVAFPAAYFVLLPAFYLPVMLMLFALIFRGIAFAFRFQAGRLRWIWDWAFAGGSLCATVAQGLILGGFIDGVQTNDGLFAGSIFDFANLLGVFCALGLVGGYSLLGAGWLIWKTEGPTQIFAREVGHAGVILTSTMLLIVSAWTAITEPEVSNRWFGWPNILWLAPVPFLSIAILMSVWRNLWGRRTMAVFFQTILLFLLGFFGLAVSLWPYVVPRSINIHQALSDDQTLEFGLLGAVAIVPIVLAYQSYAYWVFRGKTKLH